MSPALDTHRAEALRQQRMLQALWRRLPAQALAGELQGTPQRQTRGWVAYSTNAAAAADRVLAGIYPVLSRCIGAPAMAVLARQAWRQAPPQRGDLDAWDPLGEALPRLLAEAPPLADRPWLADLARLEWAVHQAERAADAPELADGPPAGLDGLAAPDAPLRRLLLRPGAAVLPLHWPVARLWLQSQTGIQALAGGPDAAQPDAQPDVLPDAPPDAPPDLGPAPQSALVMRRGWRATVQPLPPGDATFMAAVLAGLPLGAALDAAATSDDPAWSFEHWLLRALRGGWITAVQA